MPAHRVCRARKVQRVPPVLIRQSPGHKARKVCKVRKVRKALPVRLVFKVRKA